MAFDWATPVRTGFSVFVTLLIQQPLNAQESNSLSAGIVAEFQQMIPNFDMVSPVLARGGQPNAEALDRLKQAGVKTVVNLRDGKQDIETEKAYAHKLGLKFVSIPMSVFGVASQRQVDKFLSVLRDPENQPVFVHCRQGQDRCGTMVAMYRMADQSWSSKQAYAEMLKYGFHPVLLGLSLSLNARTRTAVKRPVSAEP